jgi:hypothetical protein
MAGGTYISRRASTRVDGDMQILLILLVSIAAAATLYVLVRGLIGMAQGASELNAERSQTLMQKRVIFQAAAILVAVLLIMLSRSN